MNVNPISTAQPAQGLLPGLRYIIVGESAARRWIVKDNRGRLGAVFRSANVALRFAQREASALGCGIVIDGAPVELDCLRSASAFR